MGDRISELPEATEAIAGNDIIAVTNVSRPGTGETQKFTQDQLLESQKLLAFRTAIELTLGSDEITVTQSNHKLQPESGTADNLATISGMVTGSVCVLYMSDPGTDTLTIKHGTGNISCAGGVDISFSEGALICYFDGTTVYVSGGGGGLAEIVEDTTPQLGGDLDLNDKGLEIHTPSADVSYEGIIRTMTVDTNAEGVGAPLFLAADGHLDTADADTIATMPCFALALETGTGSKKVLLYGALRNDAWNWTMGAGGANLIYVSEKVGTLTQTAPTTEDSVTQPIGYAISADEVMFTPSMIYITHGA